MNIEKDDTFLSRWLQNQLSEDERREFEASEDFAQFQKIRLAADQLKSPDFDEAKLLSKIKASRGAKVVSFNRNKVWYYGIAASLALLIGFFAVWFYSGAEVKVAASFGEQKTILLPDGSEMTLNAKAVAAYKPKHWIKKRYLTLDGEAFFSVKKGSTFEVETSNGIVTVLGTQFNVRSVAGYFEVTCTEGSVGVSANGEKYVLTPGMAFRTGKNIPSEVLDGITTTPGWLSGKSTFISVPLQVVLDALKNQYNIEFTGKLPNEDQLFTGSFPHNNLNVALQVVFEPLQLHYKISGDRTVELQD